MAFKFEKLEVWKESVKFASEVYSLTKKFPKTEQFGLISQFNRASVSISLNISEGSDAELSRFIQISIGSLNEVVTILYISLEQKYIDPIEFNSFYKRCEQISKMLYSLKNSLNK